jgi:hypothetical protein
MTFMMDITIGISNVHYGLCNHVVMNDIYDKNT